MVYDDDPVAREVHVEFQTIGAELQPLIERRERVLGRERAAATVREHKRTCSEEKRMGHERRVSLTRGGRRREWPAFAKLRRVR